MVVVLKPQTSREQMLVLAENLKKLGVNVAITEGVTGYVLGILGDTSKIDQERVELFPEVEKVMRVQEPYKKANRKFHPNDTIVDICGRQIGGNKLAIIAGPCSVETPEQITSVANSVKNSGAGLLRGGAFKPRTSPYAFQGLEDEGLELLKVARANTGLPIVTEIMSPKYVEIFEEAVDVVQVGARNMQNFDLLKEVGKMSKPILLKRGLANTIEEWLMSAEYIMASGNENVILCERGIRTYETYTRNTLDISAIPAIKKLSHLPIIVDPSHAAGRREMVLPLSLAAIAAGADGLIVEVHNDPANAKCDGPQSLTPEQFQDLMNRIKPIAESVGREL
ncbi:3-deoxy-7-phosphoheptulonate synthase [Clostridium cellulovorans]|uniref:Phospho-2-dehydro-3-deoxyheptonate aldolase n=1 Tax=Clostridium cellulovorans (strain ATCC 35296 / DSM 3052 / OCM 3 / 743B) TaxID=573061 RepID=D9SPR8_CLOC7|nr:3-deoxy-7-phosphoheptulonate synthase [Clostridium cellulovorans]ADL50117.1 phospho-2-dehydro-3-deoxyheptonate aldolase [Clostridium cellulovorans 743B]